MPSKQWYNKTYSNVRHFTSDFFEGVGIGADYMRYPLHQARRGIDAMDTLVQHGSKVKIANDVLSLLTDNPLYAETLGLVHSVDKSLEDVGRLAWDISAATAMAPEKSRFRYHYEQPTRPVAFDQGFVPARGDIASIRGEPQISGARDYAADFSRLNPRSTPHETSHPNTSIDAISGGHIPGAASPPGGIVHGEPTASTIDDGWTQYLPGFTPAGQPPPPDPTPEDPNYLPFLPGPTPAAPRRTQASA